MSATRVSPPHPDSTAEDTGVLSGNVVGKWSLAPI